MNGPAATDWRQLALRMGTDELKLQFTAAMRSIFPQGMNAIVEKFDGLDTSNGYLSEKKTSCKTPSRAFWRGAIC